MSPRLQDMKAARADEERVVPVCTGDPCDLPGAALFAITFRDVFRFLGACIRSQGKGG